MTRNDHVDILMACYNGENFLAEQLQSLFNQTHQHFTLLIRDDGSTDNTLTIIEQFSRKYPKKIQVVPSNRRLGVKGNFSELMKASQADYVMFSDQDDIWMAEKIEKSLEKLIEMETLCGCDMPLLVHTDLTVIDQNGAIKADSFFKYTKLYPENFQTLNRFLTQNVVTGCALIMNKTLCRLAYPIPQETFMHDWWVALVASALGRVVSIAAPIIHYRQHTSNALGAKKFGSWGHLKERLSNLWIEDEMKHNQAALLLRRYKDQLSSQNAELIQSYLRLKKIGWFGGRFSIIKNQFYKSGFLRNLVAFFVKVQP